MVEAGCMLAHPHRASQYSHSLTSSYHESNLSAGMLNSGPNSRPPSGPGSVRSHHIALPHTPEFKSPTYGIPYGPGPSPTDPSPSRYGDYILHGNSRAATPGMSGSHLSSLGLHAQKRAYRQRRKDPSCDACRERKVKVLDIFNRPSPCSIVVESSLTGPEPVRCNGHNELFRVLK